jgi:hypothetical protein
MALMVWILGLISPFGIVIVVHDICEKLECLSGDALTAGLLAWFSCSSMVLLSYSPSKLGSGHDRAHRPDPRSACGSIGQRSTGTSGVYSSIFGLKWYGSD